MSLTLDGIFFPELAADYPQWKWYAIADSAQSRSLPGSLLEARGEARCLLGATQGTPLAAASPHLVPLPEPHAASRAWQWIARHARQTPCVSVIVTLKNFDEIFAHLEQFTEIVLPDGDTMFFAFWDPAILGTLIGQPDDETLQVRGPVLSAEQRSVLLEGVEGWWYWDREGERHGIDVRTEASARAPLPLQLSQAQVDDLVEASVPDHVLYYLDLNQPLLLAKIEPRKRYSFVKTAVQSARDIGLEGMQDLLNYVCAALIYQERLQQDEQIKSLLEAVKHGSLSFTAALNEMP